MLRRFLLIILVFPHALMAEERYNVQNSNFTISQRIREQSTLYNYNRLRLKLEFKEDKFFALFIGDGINYLSNYYVNSQSFKSFKQVSSDTPFKTQTPFKTYGEGSAYAKIYRVYGGYEDDDNKVEAGLVNITMGVGRIWTPTNLFNPRNIYALESDETFGVAALSYTRHLNETSNCMVVASQKEDNSYKYALRYKAFLNFSDVAVNAISSQKTKMLGYELEANLGQSGIEIRSEGAYIKTEISEFTQIILGADYGFENGITFVAEALYSSDIFSYKEQIQETNSEIVQNLVSANFYTAANLSYNFNIFLDTSLIYIESFHTTHSRFISPILTYTLNDYNTLSLGAMLFDGDSNSEFNNSLNSYYFRWNLSF